jgi:hypothetical protein
VAGALAPIELLASFSGCAVALPIGAWVNASPAMAGIISLTYEPGTMVLDSDDKDVEVSKNCKLTQPMFVPGLWFYCSLLLALQVLQEKARFPCTALRKIPTMARQDNDLA